MLDKNKLENPKIKVVWEDVDIRESDLKKDNRYGLFDLKTKGWVKTNNPYKLERLFHLYYERYRLSTKNGLKVDTELFQTEHDLYQKWIEFVKVNYLNNPIMKDEILEYKF